MAENYKRKKAVLRWNKTMICEILGCDHEELSNFISEETRDKVAFRKGVQYFNDQETFYILKDFRRLYSDAQIMALIYPKMQG